MKKSTNFLVFYYFRLS